MKNQIIAPSLPTYEILVNIMQTIDPEFLIPLYAGSQINLKSSLPGFIIL